MHRVCLGLWVIASQACVSTLEEDFEKARPVTPGPSPVIPVPTQPTSMPDAGERDADVPVEPEPPVRPDASVPAPVPTADGSATPPVPSEAGVAPAEGGTTPPPGVFQLLSSSPDDARVDVDPASDLVLEFSAEPSPGPGLIRLRAGAAVVEVLSAADPRVTTEGALVTVDVDVVLGSTTEYTFAIARDAFVDAEGNALADDVSIPFTTAPVPFHGDVSSGVSLWLDAAYQPSLKLEEGAVRLWADRSGRHQIATQDDPTLRPEFVDDGVADGPSLSFDGTDDVLLGPAPAASAGYEGFIVWETMLAAGTATTVLLDSEDAFEVTFGHVTSSARRSVTVFAGSESSSAAFQAPAPNAPTMWNFAASSAPLGVYARSQGGAPVFAALAAEATSPALPLSIGADPEGESALLARVAEILFFDRPLSNTERIGVVADLRSKWNVADPVCAADQSLGPDGSCFFVTEASTWSDAEAECAAVGPGWHLASIRSGQENEFVVELIDELSWLSGNNESSPDVWVWTEDGAPFWSGDSTGEALSGAYTNWRSGSPGVDGCVVINADMGTATGRWDVAPCTGSHPAVCQGPGE